MEYSDTPAIFEVAHPHADDGALGNEETEVVEIQPVLRNPAGRRLPNQRLSLFKRFHRLASQCQRVAMIEHDVGRGDPVLMGLADDGDLHAGWQGSGEL